MPRGKGTQPLECSVTATRRTRKSLSRHSSIANQLEEVSMDRRRVLQALGAGFLGAWGAELRAEELSTTLDRFASMDWEKDAVMSKAPGAEPPWRLRLEA